MNINYSQKAQSIRLLRSLVVLAAGLLLGRSAQAYTNYTGCATCHGDFRSILATSPKGTVFPTSNHEMHRASGNMGTACNLCHIGTSRTPVIIGHSTGTANNTGVGCTGCHMAAGLRAHHVINGVTICLTCHAAETPPPESFKPPYYGTADTRVKNPGNEVLMSGTNENWSVGDYLGLDNDGNNLYDLADYAIGPFKILSANPEGNDVRVTWVTAGGRTDLVQASGTASAGYANVSPAQAIPGVGVVTNDYVETGGAGQTSRFYRLKGQLP